jgi:hypothetical protein
MVNAGKYLIFKKKCFDYFAVVSTLRNKMSKHQSGKEWKIKNSQLPKSGEIFDKKSSF